MHRFQCISSSLNGENLHEQNNQTHIETLIGMSTVEGRKHKSMRYYTYTSISGHVNNSSESHSTEEKSWPKKTHPCLEACKLHPLLVQLSLYQVPLTSYTEPVMNSYKAPVVVLANLWLTCEETMQNLGIKQLHISL